MMMSRPAMMPTTYTAFAPWRATNGTSTTVIAPVGPDTNQPLAEVIPAEVDSPDDLTVTQELVDRVAAGMEKLNAKHREILILRNVKNLSYEEIAAILHLSIGTVKSRIARARDRLRDKIGDDLT